MQGSCREFWAVAGHSFCAKAFTLPLRFQVTTMMAEAEKDGKPLPMVNGKARRPEAADGVARAVDGLMSVCWLSTWAV